MDMERDSARGGIAMAAAREPAFFGKIDSRSIQRMAPFMPFLDR
jgi:hypothetical protein